MSYRKVGKPTLDQHISANHEVMMEYLEAVGADIRKLTHLIKAYILRPGPGRPRHPKITLAASMHAQGKPWNEIFAVCLPDRALYDSGEAFRNAKLGLKKAVRQRERRMGQGLHNTVRTPKMAENFDCLPEQLLDRVRHLHVSAPVDK